MIENKRYKDKLSGKIRFPEDLNSKRTLTAKVIRSTVNHALIKEILIPPTPENIIVMSAKDIPGKNLINLPEGSMPILAKDKTFFKGEAILLAAGSDEEELLNYISTIKIEYEKLPELEQPVLEENYVLQREVIKGDPITAIENSWHTFHAEFSTPSQEHLSTPLLSAYVKPEGQKMTIHCASQWPNNVVQNIASATGLKKKDLRIKINPLGKTEDSKIWMPSLVTAQAALLAQKSKKPVKLIYSAHEDFLCSPKRIPVEFSYEMAIDKNGKIMGLDINLVLDTGSYTMMTKEILDRLCLGSAGLYKCKNIRVRGKVYTSNKPPLGAFSGFGLAQAFFASERMATIVAEKLKWIQKKEINLLLSEAEENNDEAKIRLARNKTTIDPAIWRLQNLYAKNSTFLSGGKIKKDPPIKDLLKQLIKISDFTRKYAAYSKVIQNSEKIKSSPGRRRGIGISCSYMGNNFLRREKGLYSNSIICRLDKEGQLTIICSLYSNNVSLYRYWKQIAIEILSIGEENIEILNDEEQRIPLCGPSTLSRNICITTKLVTQCCEQIKKKRFRDPLPIEIKKSYKHSVSRKWDTNSFNGLPFHDLSWSACAVEVEIDESNFIPIIRKIWIINECGQIIDRDSAFSEVESELMQAIGWCSIENLPISGNSLMSRSIAEYSIPKIYDLPNIEVNFSDISLKYPKGLGSLSLNSFPAAYCSAVSLATGSDFNSLPIKPNQIFSALEGR